MYFFGFCPLLGLKEIYFLFTRNIYNFLQYYLVRENKIQLFHKIGAFFLYFSTGRDVESAANVCGSRALQAAITVIAACVAPLSLL
jgi:hypothetical protein